MNEINDLINSDIETREITDLSSNEYENYSVSDLINIPLVVGPQGPPNVLSIGEVTTGEKSGASITGDSPNQKLNLILEKGDAGPQGPPGTPAKNIIVEITNRIIETEIEQNTNYEVPAYEVGTNSLSVYFEGCKLIKDENYIEVDSMHIQFKDWDVPVDSNLEIIIRKEEE